MNEKVFSRNGDSTSHKLSYRSVGNRTILTFSHVYAPVLHWDSFDVITGEALGPPAPIGVFRYNVRVVGDDIEVEV